MPSWSIYIAEFLLLSFLFYHALMRLAPALIFSTAQKKAKLPFNTAKYHDLPQPQATDTTMPDPDFLYVSGFYDLAGSPLRISGDIAQTDYWSIAFYQNDTINYFVKNRRQFGEDAQRFEVVLKQAAQKPENVGDATVVSSPTARGAFLIRILVSNRQNGELVKKCKAWQQSVKLEKLNFYE